MRLKTFQYFYPNNLKNSLFIFIFSSSFIFINIRNCKCGDEDILFTKAQLLDIISKYPHLEYFVRSFSYMSDDDLYFLPKTWMEAKNNDECAFFNHSCETNIGYLDDAFADNIVK